MACLDNEETIDTDENDEDTTAHEDALACLDNDKETIDTKMVGELDDGDVTSTSYDGEMTKPGADTGTGPSIVEDANSSAEGTDKNIDATSPGLLRAPLTPGAEGGAEGTLEGHSDAEMMEVSDELVIVEELGS